MEYKYAKLEIKADVEGEEGSITGYGAVFGNVDGVGDVVVSGAFKNSLDAGLFPKMLWNHDPSTVIGIFDEVREDEKGLFVKGRFADTEKGKEIRELVKLGAIDSLSIGYRTVDYAYTNEGNRLLKEVRLYEVSLVTFPANELASITSIKSDNEIISLLHKRIQLLKGN
ncbi:HK97 family phage prohead protease [Cereibacter changlensis]|uniref:HK97 family phage prohead protease n=1 Tax=Cereibacter changlensis TaxID=402884 RepID=UPI0040331B16